MKNKRGLGSLAIVALVVLGIIGIAGAAHVGVFGDNFKGFLSAAPAPPSPEEEVQTIDFCRNNPEVALDSRYQDIHATSATSRKVNYYLHDLTIGSITNVTPNDPESGATVNTNDNIIKCNHAYDIYVESSTNDNALDAPFHVNAEDTRQDPVFIDVKGSQYSNLRARVKDKAVADAYIYANESSTASDFVDLQSEANKQSMIYRSTTDNATATTIGSDVTSIYEIGVKTNATQSEFGHGFYIALDTEDATNTADVDEDTVSLMVAGVSYSDVSGSIPANDQKALSSSEMVYKIPSGILKQSTVIINLEYTPEAGTNPDFDVIMRFVPLGTYLDDDDPNKILSDVGFRTNAARTVLLDANLNSITFDIS